jgi:nucleoside-diphosphate-sugar epimerase
MKKEQGVKTIAIIGANGQVGSEVALYLSLFPGVKVLPICRSRLASTILRRCGLECRHGDISEESQCRELLSGCDVVADLSLPKGLPSQIRVASRRLVANAIRYAPPTATYVYMSSIMAYGMKEYSQRLRHYRIPRTVYASWKRYAEKLALRLGAQHRRPVYILRLGDVHGELQNISGILLTGIRNETAWVPGGYSYTVFAFSIAEALANIAYAREVPGRYMLVSEPGYTWKEVFEVYARRAGMVPAVVVEASEPKHDVMQWMVRAASGVIDPFVRMSITHRELIAGNFLHYFPRLELSLKAAYSRRQARLDIASRRADHYRPFLAFRGETVPGARLRSLSDPRESMAPMEARLRALLKECL